MPEGLAATWSRLGHPRVLVVGDLILDRYLWGDVDRISPEAPIPILNVTRQESRPGGAASVAANLAVLEARVTLCGLLGDHEPARTFRTLLAERGIDDSGIIVDESRRTTVKTRVIAHVQHLLRIDEEDVSPISDLVRSRVCAFLENNVSNFDIVLVSDYAKGLITPELMRHLVAACRKAGLRVLVDPARIPDYSLYRGVNAVTPNRAESELATATSIGPDGPLRTASALLDRLDLEAAIITLDREGIALLERDHPLQLFPTHVRTVYDVTGAGDMVLSVLGLVLASGGSYADAVRLANVAGGLEVERIGVTPLSRPEIASALSGPLASPDQKIKSLPQLLAALDEHRRRGETIAFTNGCFDVLHAGHLRSLQAARACGDVLVVGLNSDESVRRLKGPDRPIYNQTERAEILAALSDVAYVTVFDEDSSLNLIKAVRPDVLVKGRDWERKGGVVGQEFVESYGGRVQLVDLVTTVSTTVSTSDIISRVLARKRPDK